MLYHHGHILGLAKKAYERSLHDDSESFVSITLSALALECYINDFSHRASTELLRLNVEPLADLAFHLETLESVKAPLLAKIETIHYVLGRTSIDRGSKWFQDLTMLVRLRNDLVHRKPESTGQWGLDEAATYEPHQFVKFFSDRSVIPRPDPHAPPTWSQYINKPEVAKWAHNVVVKTILGIVDLIPPSYLGRIQAI